MAYLQRTASAVWNGTLREGDGRTSVGSGLFRDAPVTFVSRFEEGEGTNPEELVAAAHASCFSMALAAALAKADTPSEELRTSATVTLRTGQEGPRITAVHLDVVGRVMGIDEEAFRAAAEDAKANCPVSKLLAPGLETLTLQARLQV